MRALRPFLFALGSAGLLASLENCQPAEMDGEKPKTVDSTAYACSGKTKCSEMRSCAEARYYLAHCPNVEIDGDSDGEPCEEQWCH